MDKMHLFHTFFNIFVQIMYQDNKTYAILRNNPTFII